MSYDANAEFRAAVHIAFPALRPDQVDAAVIRLLASQEFTNALRIALEDNDWMHDEAVAIATDIVGALDGPMFAQFNPHTEMETR